MDFGLIIKKISNMLPPGVLIGLMELLDFFSVKLSSEFSSVRDRNSGNDGFLDVINFTYCHTLQSQQGCLRLRELRDVTNGVIISSN